MALSPKNIAMVAIISLVALMIARKVPVVQNYLP
mgnify:CR=1 FL=1